MVTEGGLIVLVKLLQELKRENLSSLKKEHQKDKKNQKQILKNLLLLPPQQKHKAAQAPAPQPQAAPEPAPEDQSQEVPPLTIVFGRFNPPTVGHDKLLKSANRISAGGDVKIYPSRTQDPKKNPLDPDMKISFMKKMFPDFKEIIINDDNMRSIFDVLINANEEGYSSVNIVVGSDRQAEFENLAQKYNGDLYNFDLINVISAGVRDADADGIEGMSASKMRKAVLG
jgi:phosphopantetheine adenylyltransferase